MRLVSLKKDVWVTVPCWSALDLRREGELPGGDSLRLSDRASLSMLVLTVSGDLSLTELVDTTSLSFSEASSRREALDSRSLGLESDAVFCSVSVGWG